MTNWDMNSIKIPELMWGPSEGVMFETQTGNLHSPLMFFNCQITLIPSPHPHHRAYIIKEAANSTLAPSYTP